MRALAPRSVRKIHILLRIHWVASIKSPMSARDVHWWPPLWRAWSRNKAGVRAFAAPPCGKEWRASRPDVCALYAVLVKKQRRNSAFPLSFFAISIANCLFLSQLRRETARKGRYASRRPRAGQRAATLTVVSPRFPCARSPRETGLSPRRCDAAGTGPFFSFKPNVDRKGDALSTQ